MQKSRITFGCLGIFVGFVLVLSILGSAYLINFALRPKVNKGRDYAGQLAVMKSRYTWIAPWVDSLNKAKAFHDTTIVAPDGDRHHAVYVAAPFKTAKTAVLVHGYTDCAMSMLHMGYLYNKVLGMNLFIPDLHASGKSEGKSIQMGWPGRLDVLRWIGIADSLFADSTGHARIVVHGISMGAATTMDVSGEQTPASVKCFVEDCGYTSVWDEFEYELADQFHLPAFPMLYTASALCKLKYGWSFGESSPLKQVAKCKKPMLFIHGGNDTYVPTRMVYPLYATKPAPKQLVVFRRSAHARSYLDHHDAYTRIVSQFVQRYL